MPLLKDGREIPNDWVFVDGDAPIEGVRAVTVRLMGSASAACAG